MRANSFYQLAFCLGVIGFAGMTVAGIYRVWETQNSPPPVYINYLKSLQELIVDEKDYESAIENLQLAVRLDSFGRRPKHYFELARAAYHARDQQSLDQAVQGLRAFVESGTAGDSRTYYYLAVTLVLQNGVSASELAEAVSLSQKTLELEPDYAPAHSNAGVASLMLGNVDQAESHFLKALQLDPENGQALRGLQHIEPKAGMP